MSKEIVLNLFDLLQTKGSDLQYGNENITQLEHALQCAELAKELNKINLPIEYFQHYVEASLRQ